MKPDIQTPTNQDGKRDQMNPQTIEFETETMKRDGLTETSET